jgi:hypothetical protein
MTLLKRRAAALAAGVIITLVALQSASAEEWMPLVGAFHVHTSEFSSGAHTLEELVAMARERAVDVIILTDHDQVSMTYGVSPFRNVFSWTVSRNAVLKRGAQAYLDAVNHADEKNLDIILIPGLESAPFYYWDGSIREGTLTARDWRKHLHVIGLSNHEDIEDLPTLRRGFTARYFFRLVPPFLIFLGASLFSIVLITWGGTVGVIGKVLLLAAVVGAIDAHPFKLSPFDPFHGQQGAAPYQELIDYVSERGGMTFWAHPEANYGVGEIVYPGRAAPVSLPQVKMSTGRHPHSLIHTEGYTGFESLYGDTIHVTDIGREWDRTLIMYTEGVRKTPAWGICGLDFHKEGMNGWSWLDRGQTVFLVHDRSREAVLDAMRHGRMYAVYQGGSAKLRMDLFTLSSKATGQEAVSGGTIGSMGKPLRVTLELTLTGGDAVPIRVDLIDSGKVLSTIHGETPLRVDRDFFPARPKGYIRVDVRSDNHRILSNPIFYK